LGAIWAKRELLLGQSLLRGKGRGERGKSIERKKRKE